MRFLPETLLTLIKEHQTITTHNANRQCRVLFYACMRKPLPKRLYMQTLPTRYLKVRELGTGSLGTERWELHLLHSTVHPKLGERPFRRFSVRGSSSLAAVLEWKNHFIVCTDHWTLSQHKFCLVATSLDHGFGSHPILSGNSVSVSMEIRLQWTV